MFTLSSLDTGNKFTRFKDCSNLNFSESLADPTYFVPNSEAVKRVQNSSAVVGSYDFADGKDTRDNSMLFYRRKGLDLAEITQHINANKQKLDGLTSELDTIIEKNNKAKNKNSSSDSVGSAGSASSAGSATSAGSAGSTE